MSEAGTVQRLDRWLFFSRLIKSREKAQALIRGGHVRLNGKRCDTPAASLRAGDVLTLSFERAVRVVRVKDCGLRRGPAAEARMLYEEIADPTPIPRLWP
jgi:ribosome-associated heat shock protein Hsp15